MLKAIFSLTQLKRLNFMSELNLDLIRKELEKQRDTLIERIQQEEERSGQSNRFNPDRSDLAQNFVSLERRTILLENMRNQLEQIYTALERLNTHTYGKCIYCGEEIKPERLEALPYVATCIKCQEKYG